MPLNGENSLTIVNPLRVESSIGFSLGTRDHSKLANLDYEHAGHTGFQPSEEGKGLSANDYTNEDKEKVNDLLDIYSLGDGLSLSENGELDVTIKGEVLDVTVGGQSVVDQDGTAILGSSAGKNISESGDASDDEVVLGNDTRLTNDRPNPFGLTIQRNGSQVGNAYDGSNAEVINIETSEVLNDRSNSQENPYSANYVNNTFAPLSFVSNLYATKVNESSATLENNKPSIATTNTLTSLNTTNTDYNWNLPEFTFTRTLSVATTLTNTNSFDFSLAFTIDRNAIISWGAKIKISEDNGQTWSYISTSQSYGGASYDAGVGNTSNINIVTNLINGATTYPIGTLLAIEIYKKQTSPNSLSTTVYCGVLVDGADIFTYTNFNIANININTNQIEDGAITYDKLSDDLQIDIDKIDNKQDIIQFRVMPNPELSLVGNIVQYIGLTDSNYTNGFFYKCISDGLSPASYSWQNVVVDDFTNYVDLASPQTISGNKNFTGLIQKDGVDLVNNTDYANNIVGGVVKCFDASGAMYSGIYISNEGILKNYKAQNSDIDAKTNDYQPIVPSNLDYAIKRGLGANTLTWTDGEKQNARNIIDAVGKEEYASSSASGVVKVNASYGIRTNYYSGVNGMLEIVRATESEIIRKENGMHPIVPVNLDFAVRSVLPLTSDTAVATLVAQTEYYLGEKATLTYALPATGVLGQYILVCFGSGATATTLTVSGTVVGDTITPVANKTYEILYTWNGSAWVCSYRAY